MTGILNALIAGVSGAVKDAYFNLVSLLLPGNGTDGANNNTFLDSSTNNFTITRNPTSGPNAPTQGTFSPFSQTGWGNYFNGGGSGFLNAVTDTAFAFGTGDFTLEAYLYCTSYPSAGTVRANIISAHNWNGSGFNFTFRLNQTGYLEFEVSSVITSSSIVPLNTWTHVACVRSSGTITFYINGVASGGGAQSNSLASTTPISIGAALSGGTYGNYTGYISNARIVKGVVVYTGNFTPPIVPLAATQSAGTNISAITGTQTSLLTCQNNRFKDNSTYNFALTSGSGTSVTPFSPFAPTQSYSASAVGGSGYFDGTGDYLSAADNAAFSYGTGDFTVEFWMYPTTTGATKRLYFHQTTSTTQFSITQLSANTINVFANNSSTTIIDITGSTAISANTWTHVAVVRSGNTFTLYQNGTSVASGTSSSSMPDPTGSLYIGALDTGSDPYTGYLASYRIVKGTAITPPSGGPTAPLTAVSGTSLLLNFTNGGVIDATAKNVLETVGNAQISTTQSKWGGGSISFDGTGDYLKAPDDVNWDLGSSNFTIEAWVYPTASPLQPILIGQWTSSYAWLLTLSNDSNRYLRAILYNGSFNDYVSTSPLQLNTWNHCAMVRESNTVSLYLNGSRVYTTTFTGSVSTSTSAVTVGANASGADPFTGYMDDVRITKGVARYSGSSYTVPAAPFALQ